MCTPSTMAGSRQSDEAFLAVLCIQVQLLTSGHLGAYRQWGVGPPIGGCWVNGRLGERLHRAPCLFPGLCATRPAELTLWLPCVLQNAAPPIATPRKWDQSRPLEDAPGLHGPGTMVFALVLGGETAWEVGGLAGSGAWTHLSGDPNTSLRLPRAPKGPSLTPGRWKRPHSRTRTKGKEQRTPWLAACPAHPRRVPPPVLWPS